MEEFQYFQKLILPEFEDCNAVVDLENLLSIAGRYLVVLADTRLGTEPLRVERLGNRFSFDVILVFLSLRQIII